MRAKWNSYIYLTICWCVLTSGVLAEQHTVRLGVVQGGEHAWHSLLRGVVVNQLGALAPDSINIITPAEGFVDGGWDRQVTRERIGQLVAADDVDMVLALGPWVVEDLLEAGFERPIVALHRFDPIAEGLIDSAGRPIAENLTVNVYPERYRDDLTTLRSLHPIDTLAVMHFPSGDETTRILDRLQLIGEQLGMHVLSVEGFTPGGEYAFFKAYQSLPTSADAVYVSPLWGVTGDAVREFFAMARRDRRPVFSAEGSLPVQRGALACGAGYTPNVEATVAAWKIVRIVNGIRPADLPVRFRQSRALAINGRTAESCGIEVDDVTAAEAVILDQPSEGDRYTYGEVLAAARSRNPGVLAMYDRLEAAVRASAAAYGDYLPHVSLDAQAVRVGPNTVHNSFDEVSRDQWTAALRLEQTVFSAPAIRDIQLLAGKRDSVRLSAEIARRDLELAVTLAYLDVLEAGELLAAERSALAALDAFYERYVGAAQVEVTSPAAPFRLAAARSSVHARIVANRAAQEVAIGLLNLLLDHPAERPLQLDSSAFTAARHASAFARLRAIIDTRHKRDRALNRIVTEALAFSPDFRQADVRLELQDSRRDAVRASYLPQIGFQATFGLQDRLIDRAGEFEEERSTWSLGAYLNWSLFEGGGRLKRGQQLQFEYSALAYQREQFRLQVTEQLRRAFTGVTHSLIAGLPLERAADRSREYVELMQQTPEYDLAVVLDAVANLRNTRVTAIENRFAYYRSTARVARTVGWSMIDRNTSPAEAMIAFLLSPKEPTDADR
ncbi:hypothetical protein GF420_01755 [candidate division GN15 bacterium]|nr:hypothetical protein [candidate division GN15 bacterium]